MSFDFAKLNYELTKIVDQNMDLRFQKFLNKVKELDDSLDDKFLKLAWSKAGEVDGIPADATCPYVPSRGKNTGIACGGKRRIGGKYCSAHRKYEGKETGKETGKVSEKSENTEKTSRSSSVASRTVGSTGTVGKKAEQDRRIRPHFELSKLWHSQSGLTFEIGPDGARVDGKIVDGVLRDLTEKDLDIVYTWQFPIDPELENKVKKSEEVEEVEKKVSKVKELKPEVKPEVKEKDLKKDLPKKKNPPQKKPEPEKSEDSDSD